MHAVSRDLHLVSVGRGPCTTRGRACNDGVCQHELRVPGQAEGPMKPHTHAFAVRLLHREYRQGGGSDGVAQPVRLQ